MIPSDLYQLIHSLRTAEIRYIVSKGKRENGSETEYLKLFEVIRKLNFYDKDEYFNAIKSLKLKGSIKIKKHYLFLWILRQLREFYYNENTDENRLVFINILISRSLYHAAYKMIKTVKQTYIESEKFDKLFTLLEMELVLSRFIPQLNPSQIQDELENYSLIYSQHQTFQSLRLRFRKTLDKYVFIRTEEQKATVDRIMAHPLLKTNAQLSGFKNNYIYNLIFYWNYASKNNWQKAILYANNNFKLIISNDNCEDHFPEETISSAYNMIVASITNKTQTYKTALKYLKELMRFENSERLKSEAQFYFHLSQLILINSQGIALSSINAIKEAEKYLINFEDKMDIKRINNFKFDLAKVYFNQKEYKKSFLLFKQICDSATKEVFSIDFISFSRILFCLVCYERNEIELMNHFARSTSKFLIKNNSYHQFEKRILRFIRYELTKKDNSSSKQLSKAFYHLRTELADIFELDFEKSVKLYFNFEAWAEQKIHHPKPQLLH